MSEDAHRSDDKPEHLDRLSSVWRRVNEHKLVQWSVAYVALAYAIQHGVILTAESLEWPNAVARATMLLLAIGLPVVMTCAWYHGHHASRRISGPELTIIAILLVIGSMFFYIFVKPLAQVEAGAPAVKQTSAASASSPGQSAGISLAVLPFVNLSSDKEQEFFSDGMTEEITSALAKVSGLNVVARTSAFQFKGENRDVQSIAQALHATHLIEGSVRKDGNQVRITAQLIRADNGTHLWTESYDRELKGVFAVQEEIATAIASALRVPLGLKAGQSLVSSRTSNTDSYQDYLRAKALVRGRGAFEPGGPLTEAAKLLEQVAARDPDYAPAWALLGQAYVLTPNFVAGFVNGSTEEFRRIVAETQQKAEAAAQEAVRLDPNNADGYLTLGLVRNQRGRFAETEDLYKKALALDPGNPDALHQYSLMLQSVGRLKESLDLRLRLLAQEPFVPVYNWNMGVVLWENGRSEEAISLLKAMPPALFHRYFLAEVYASVGRYSEAADALREIPSEFFLPGQIEEAVRLLRSAPAKVASPQTFLSNGFLGFVYIYAGAPEGALVFYEVLAEAGVPGFGNGLRTLWAPGFAPARRTERFKTLVRKAGLVDYWKARGWPEFCHPTTGDDFACA